MNVAAQMTALWSGRAKRFRKEIMPYLRYMGQSGFPAFLSLFVITGAIGYFKLIQELPSQFPIAGVGVAVLTLSICWSPLRTWLASADKVFLMPREGEMKLYLQHSLRYTTLGCGLLIAFVLLLYLPIYRQGAMLIDGFFIIASAALLKLGNVWGAWQERRMAWPGMRMLLRLLRWSLTAVLLYAWLTCVLWQAAAFTLLVALLFLMLYRVPDKHHFPWERLIEEEERTRKRYYVFFGMFIDVPSQSSKVARRSYLNSLLSAVPYSNRNTFVYLYTASLLRTEIGGIVIRVMLLGSLVCWMVADSGVWSGWGAAIAYGLFVIVLAVQLGALRHTHRYSVWQHVYPLPQSHRIEQYLKVDRAAFLISAGVMWLVSSLPLLKIGLAAPLITMIAAVLLYTLIRPGRLRKKIVKEADED